MRKTLLIAALLTGISGATTLPAYSITLQGYYEEQKARSCSNVSSCAVTFSADATMRQKKTAMRIAARIRI